MGQEVKLTNVFAHACMVVNSRSLEAVAAALSQPIKPDPLLPSTPVLQKLPDNADKT